MLNAVLKELDASYAKLWDTKPAEIDNIFKRNAKNGKHFSVWIGAYGAIDIVCSNAYKYVSWGKKHFGDFTTIKQDACDSMKGSAGAYRISFGMSDFADLLVKVGDAYLECKDYAEFEELSKKIHLYASRMFYWIDGMIPWAKLSETFNSLMGL